ncbi:MAG TPA: glycosyltransferase family 2 protein [Candidatus Wunengus sp. YC60]|uniref:glycosyltransferase family 2 protein n=1 Tax=Candidatus Wunengus sp. YC60 TaxID=3367697 RepID=UPI004026626A
MKAPDISIIIPTKNGGENFSLALEKIFSYRGKYGFEVIVVDSGSTDGTVQATSRYDVRLLRIRSEEFGHGKTRNHAASISMGEYLVFTTQDAVPRDENWIERLVSNFGDGRVAGIYGRQIPFNTNPYEKYFLRMAYHDRKIIKKVTEGKLISYKEIFFSNVNSAIRRDLWESNPFNENQIMSEDIEWAKRMLMKGYIIVYEPEAAVYHSHNYNPIKNFKRNFDLGVSLKGIMEDDKRSLIKDGFNYAIREICYLIKEGKWRHIPYLFIYEGFRFSGFFFGRKQRYIPLALKRRLSLHSYYWKNKKVPFLF